MLPFISKLSKQDIEILGGKDELRQQQGFYIYRNKRLIIWGTWFRLIKQNELGKLARVRVDIPNSLDSIWEIDIKKSTASLPHFIKKNLADIVEAWNENHSRTIYTDLPEQLRTHNNTTCFLDRFKVVAKDLPSSQTIVAHISRDGHYFIHPDIVQNRSLTPREAARLQTFPDNYYFESTKSSPGRTPAFRQIGNAVPVRLAYCVATELKASFLN